MLSVFAVTTEVVLCAVLWIRGDGTVINPKAQPVWPQEYANAIAEAEVVNNPDKDFKVHCVMVVPVEGGD